MNVTISYSLLISVATLGLIVIPIYLILYLFKVSTRHKKSPLNIDLLRSPGQSLREEIADLTINIITELLMIPMMVLALYAVVTTDQLNSPERNSLLVLFFAIITGVGVSLYFGVTVYRKFKRRNTLRLGYECELVVGQDLIDLVLKGFRVYHDLPADGFNIDHIAIGPTGVFAIETKGRSKQINTEKENWKLTFDGDTLHFPGWTERKPIQQARRQAKWLSNWLNSATGEPQNVVPVLVIPGWYINRKKKSDLRVGNNKELYHLANGPRVLSDKQIQKIAHQVEEKCRDIKPKAYKKD